MSDTISRKAAIDSIESHIRMVEEPYTLSREEKAMNHAFEVAASCVYNLPAIEQKRKEEGTDDLISRTAALVETWRKPKYTDPLSVLTEIRERLKALPSAQKRGKWIPTSNNGVTFWYECSECHEAGDLKDRFCRNCGVWMGEEKCT